MEQKKQVKKVGVSAGKVVAIGAGVIAAGAGAYYFLGQKGKANQKKAKVWMTKMEKEALTKIKKVKNITEPIYHNAVDTLAVNYAKQYKEYAPEIKAFAKQLKGKWKGAEKKAQPAIKNAKKVVKKTIKKVAKIVTKKQAK